MIEEQVCFGVHGIQNKDPADDDTAARRIKITDASIYDEDDGSLKVFEEGNDENPKVEEGIDKDL